MIEIEHVEDAEKRELEAIEIIDQFDYMQKALKYVLLYNKSNNIPYHNLNHLLTIVKYCYQGIMYKGVAMHKDIKDLLIAAMFHDVDHSSGKKTDDKNIIEAKKAVSEFLRAEEIEANEEVIHGLFDATQYPYVIEKKDLTPMQGIIRDSDLMQVFEYNWIHQNISGLSEELGYDFGVFLGPQKDFLNAAEFNTEWGNNMKAEKWTEVMEQFRMLEDVCKVELKSEEEI